MFDPIAYWQAVFTQDAEGMRRWLSADAQVRWHNTNECFRMEGFIHANCDYPGQFAGELLRTDRLEGTLICLVRVHYLSQGCSFHAVSYLRLQDDRIVEIDEYWGLDEPPPAWRQQLELSVPIRTEEAPKQPK